MKLDGLPTRDQCLPGRSASISPPELHFVNRHSMQLPYAPGMERAMFGMGCFWGAEKCFWQLPGVNLTAVGYAAGFTPNPTYQEVCTGMTAHNEVVLVVYDPQQISYQELLECFWQSHNPTQGMRQGNDRGTQYRSGIYTYGNEQGVQAINSKKHFQVCLAAQGIADAITTEIIAAPEFYYAEDYHQQYLAKNPDGYCGLGGLNIKY